MLGVESRVCPGGESEEGSSIQAGAYGSWVVLRPTPLSPGRFGESDMRFCDAHRRNLVA